MPLTYENCGAVILAGGQSKRMGTCKALLPGNGKLLVQHIHDQLSAFSDCRLSSNDPALDDCLPIPVIRDIYVQCGPLGGIHAALTAAEKETLFFVSCDLPYFSSEVPRLMLQAFPEEADAIVCRDRSGRIHPLCGIYRRRILPIVEAHLKAGNRRMLSLLDDIHCVFFDTGPHLPDEVLYNMNTPQDYQKFRNSAQEIDVFVPHQPSLSDLSREAAV